MLNLQTLKRHARLVDDMAQTLGVDLEETVLRGELTIDEIDDAVLNCAGCSCPDRCETWLADNQKGAAAAPRYCRNVSLFEALKPS